MERFHSSDEDEETDAQGKHVGFGASVGFEVYYLGRAVDSGADVLVEHAHAVPFGVSSVAEVGQFGVVIETD